MRLSAAAHVSRLKEPHVSREQAVSTCLRLRCARNVVRELVFDHLDQITRHRLVGINDPAATPLLLHLDIPEVRELGVQKGRQVLDRVPLQASCDLARKFRTNIRPVGVPAVVRQNPCVVADQFDPSQVG